MNIPKEVIQHVEKSFVSIIQEKAKSVGFDEIPLAFGFENPNESFPPKLRKIFDNGYHLILFPLFVNTTDVYFVCFDMGRIGIGDTITMYVPKGKEGIFVGKGGNHVKYWAEKINVKKINVVGY